MAYSKDEVKAITDKVLNMCKADAVKVDFSGGERSATRFANSSITANLIEHDQEVSITVRYGQKTASATTHQFDDESLKRTIDAVQALARRKPDNPELMPLVKPPQTYIEIDAASPSAVASARPWMWWPAWTSRRVATPSSSPCVRRLRTFSALLTSLAAVSSSIPDSGLRIVSSRSGGG